MFSPGFTGGRAGLYWSSSVPFYRLKSPIVGVAHSSTGMHIIHVAPGAILAIPDTNQQAGMIDTSYDGRTVEIFLEDLKQRAEPAEANDGVGQLGESRR